MAKILKLDHKNISEVKGKWKQKSNSVPEVQIANLIQFLKPKERIHFMNELYRVMKKGAKAQIIAPHWCASKAYGDLSFEYPPVSESWFAHLNKAWREEFAPWGTEYECDFDSTVGYALHPQLASRNMEYQQQAVSFWKEACQDTVATVIKK